jgi:2-polyprenyl-6-methoxyphenol hydroxylase-like FAD-dependent oxidoreductase
MNRTDVVVVGAGPTGLLLAAELALRGIEVTVLERLEEPDPTIKAGSINVASAEILDRRGLLPGAEEIQNRFAAAANSFAGEHARRVIRERLIAQRFPVAGHFAGILFRPDLVDQDDLVLAAHNAVGGAVLVPQHDLELLLGAHCAKLGSRSAAASRCAGCAWQATTPTSWCRPAPVTSPPVGSSPRTAAAA